MIYDKCAPILMCWRLVSSLQRSLDSDWLKGALTLSEDLFMDVFIDQHVMGRWQKRWEVGPRWKKGVMGMPLKGILGFLPLCLFFLPTMSSSQGSMFLQLWLSHWSQAFSSDSSGHGMKLLNPWTKSGPVCVCLLWNCACLWYICTHVCLSVFIQ